MSFFTRRRSSWTSCWSSDALRSVTSRLTTTFGALPSHTRAIRARDSEESVAMVTSPVPSTRIPKPVVVALLKAPRGRHGMIIREVRSRRSTIQGHCGPSPTWNNPRAADNSRLKCRMWTARVVYKH